MRYLDICAEKLGYGNYDEYLESAHWKNFIKRWTDANPKIICKSCNSRTKKSQPHITTYKNMGKEKFSDMIYLCETCLKLKPLMETPTLESLKELNKKSKKVASKNKICKWDIRTWCCECGNIFTVNQNRFALEKLAYNELTSGWVCKTCCKKIGYKHKFELLVRKFRKELKQDVGCDKLKRVEILPSICLKENKFKSDARIKPLHLRLRNEIK